MRSAKKGYRYLICDIIFFFFSSLSVKAPNGSLENANEPIRDEELG